MAKNNTTSTIDALDFKILNLLIKRNHKWVQMS